MKNLLFEKWREDVMKALEMGKMALEYFYDTKTPLINCDPARLQVREAWDLLESLRPLLSLEWNNNDISMIDWLINIERNKISELQNDKFGHQEIISDLKRDCRERITWLEELKRSLTIYVKAYKNYDVK